ncbi:hypothetical protein [Psychrobacillus sp. MER TA 171]|uniref:hypothetical protein n=1 Tax=Psychrobacillus sp. MER TA 171 TaxID=2939577 RepID=UPI00203F897B|nr:hypothetical protein [Psychrobacillus sp. MER TA 171]MCM3359678.1 hypothetical protein [Psychrobacillus sp. MER TA 171]
MSIATYIGLNFEIAVSDEFTDDPIEIGYCFSDEENRLSIKERHFTTQFVYEICDYGEAIWNMNEYNQQYSPHNFEKAKKTFIQLCEFLNELIPDGDYCEIYICWVGDETEPMEYKVTIDLKKPVIEPLKQYEKCYIKFSK